MEKNTFLVQRNQRIIMALCGSSGVGKTTLIREIRSRYPDMILSMAATTRKPREEELKTGSKYRFVSLDLFSNMIANNEFLEYAERYGNYYGELKDPLVSTKYIQSDAIIDTTYNGAKQIADNIHEKVITIGILPPSMEELLKRLTARDPNKLDEVKNRFRQLELYIQDALLSDYLVINDNLAKAVDEICNIYESLKNSKNYIHIDLR